MTEPQQPSNPGPGSNPDPGGGTGATTSAPAFRLRPRHFGYLALLAVVVVSVVVLFRKAEEGSGVLQNSAIERLIPTADAKVLQQDLIGIDLAPGYEGRLALDGVPLPDDEVTVVAPLNQITYRPGPGRTFEALPQGTNCLTATYWMSSKGEQQSSRFTWCFTVV